VSKIIILFRCVTEMRNEIINVFQSAENNRINEKPWASTSITSFVSLNSYSLNVFLLIFSFLFHRF